jgi:excisionase family DNA binding protein
MPDPRPPTIASIPRVALRMPEAAEALGVSERTVESLVADRTSRFPVVRVGCGEGGEGRAVLVPVDGLRQWLADRLNRDAKD